MKNGIGRKDAGFRRARWIRAALFVLCACALCGCGKATPKATTAPNEEVTYEKGSDLTGVVREIDTDAQAISIYNPVTESEETFLYDGATSIQSKNGLEKSMTEVGIGEVYDLYVEGVGSKLSAMKASENIVEAESSPISIDAEIGRAHV